MQKLSISRAQSQKSREKEIYLLTKTINLMGSDAGGVNKDGYVHTCNNNQHLFEKKRGFLSYQRKNGSSILFKRI